MSDENIGSKKDYLEYDPARSNPHPDRPTEGFIEERLCKLESKVKNLEYFQSKAEDYQYYNDQKITAEERTHSDGMRYIRCKGCSGPIPIPLGDGVAFKICDECIDNLGEITNTKRNWCFK